MIFLLLVCMAMMVKWLVPLYLLVLTLVQVPLLDRLNPFPFVSGLINPGFNP
jgi:hypothetical protein